MLGPRKNMMTKFFHAHLAAFLFSFQVLVGMGGGGEVWWGDSRLSVGVSGLPGEASVDFVPCLEASAVCGFLTCQSAILRGLW